MLIRQETIARTLKYDVAVLKEGRTPSRCLWGKAGRILRHDRLYRDIKKGTPSQTKQGPKSRDSRRVVRCREGVRRDRYEQKTNNKLERVSTVSRLVNTLWLGILSVRKAAVWGTW